MLRNNKDIHFNTSSRKKYIKLLRCFHNIQPLLTDPPTIADGNRLTKSMSEGNENFILRIKRIAALT